MGFSRFNMHNLDAQAPASGPGLGTQLGVPFSNQLPQANGMPIYNQADAEKAWGKLLALYKAALA